MIFYFSATGNSKYAAERAAAATEDHLIFLRDAIRSRSYRYEAAPHERIGFVTPTYFFGLPSIVTFFLEKLQLSGYENQYIYLILTCGASTGGAADQMQKLLEKKGLALSARFGIPMVDNYIPLGPIVEEEEAVRRLDEADLYLDDACRVIRARGIGDYNRCQGTAPGAKTALAYALYTHGRSTRPFVVSDKCISCGLCQEICPCGAISLTGGRPVWHKPQCVQCLGCLHRCPTEAIHWKSLEEDRGRYYNPRVEP